MYKMRSSQSTARRSSESGDGASVLFMKIQVEIVQCTETLLQCHIWPINCTLKKLLLLCHFGVFVCKCIFVQLQ